jgi:hypothetical protein
MYGHVDGSEEGKIRKQEVICSNTICEITNIVIQTRIDVLQEHIK